MWYRFRHGWLGWCIVLLAIWPAGALQGQMKDEALLMDELVKNLRSKDAIAYTTQFADFDSVWLIAKAFVPTTPDEAKRIANIKSKPGKLQQLDPAFNHTIELNFKALIMKGIDSGIHWSEIMLVRYELEKMLLPREMIGFEKIAKYRLQGFVFFQDMLTTRIYGMAVTNIFSFNNKWYGGEVVNVQEASTVEEYLKKLTGERKKQKELLLAKLYGEPEKEEEKEEKKDVAKKAGERDYLQMDMPEFDEEEEEEVVLQKVLDRKYYVGTLDGEINIELYLRSLQGDCPEPVCGWEAIYRFGSNEEYYWLKVTKRPDGTMYMIEDTEEGALELTIAGPNLTGVWQSPQDKTEYKVDMEEIDIKPKVLYGLDDLIESY